MNILILQSTESEIFYFIKCPALSKNTVPIYRLLESNGDIQITLNEFEYDINRHGKGIKYKLKKQFLNYIKHYIKSKEDYFKQYLSGAFKYKFKGGSEKLDYNITL